MADYITDPELLKQLNGEPAAATGAEYVTDPALLAQLNPAVSAPAASMTDNLAPTAVAPTFAITSPTGAAQVVGDLSRAGVFDPIKQSFLARGSEYLAKPGKAILDAASVMATGLPVAPMAMYDTYKAVKESAPAAMQALRSIPNVSQETFMTLANKLNPAELGQLGQLVKTGGGTGGLTAFELPARLAQDAEAVAAINALKAEATAAPGMVSRLGMPVLRGLAKAAGPAGLAYDVYEAGKFAQEAELGRRLAQGEGEFAPNAYGELLNQNISQYQPTPQEAANLLASGDQRTIEMYGGAQRLAQAAAARSAEPVQESWIDRAMNISRKYRPQ